MQNIEMNREDGILSDTQILQKPAERKALSYILAVNILMLTIVATAFFSLPKIIEAYSIAQNNRTDFAMDKAEWLMNSYRDNILSVFEEDHSLDSIEAHFGIFPEPSYPEGVEFYEYSGWYSPGAYPAARAWRHAYNLYYAGKIHGATAGYWCTFFAQMWFYDMFGFNSSGNSATGSGASFASTVYRTAVYYNEEGELCHYFEYDDKPMTMGIVSIYSSTNPDGHVLCVDEVDYFNNTITVSEGNVSGYGDVRIRQTMSLDTFYYLNPGYKVYVNPTPELINMINGN